MWSKCFLYIRRCLSVDLNTVEFFPYQSTQRNILLGSLTRIKDIGFKQTNIFCGTLTFTRVLCITSVDNYHMWPWGDCKVSSRTQSYSLLLSQILSFSLRHIRQFHLNIRLFPNIWRDLCFRETLLKLKILVKTENNSMLRKEGTR